MYNGRKCEVNNNNNNILQLISQTINDNNTAIYTYNTINNDIINDDKNEVHNEPNMIQLLLDLTKKVQNMEQQLSEQNNHIKELKILIFNKSIKV